MSKRADVQTRFDGEEWVCTITVGNYGARRISYGYGATEQEAIADAKRVHMANINA